MTRALTGLCALALLLSVGCGSDEKSDAGSGGAKTLKNTPDKAKSTLDKAAETVKDTAQKAADTATDAAESGSDAAPPVTYKCKLCGRDKTRAAGVPAPS